MKSTPARGRRPGQSDSRDRILVTATEAFLSSGYQAASLRSIASTAGVDVALISYFFGSKQGLFAAAMSLTVSPADVLQSAMAGDNAGLAERVLRGFLQVWDDPTSGAPLRAIAGAAAHEPSLNRLVREAVGGQLIEPLTARIGGDDAQQRAAVFSTQVAGLVFARYLLGLEPIASMTVDDIVTYLLPALRVTLRAD